MTKEVTGYKFNSINAAENAQNSLRVHYLGEPKEGCVTTQWVNVETGTFEGESFWYILGDFSPVLGFPQVFNIDVEEL